MRGIAASHLNIIENGMRFQNLKQDKKILRLANGIVIESSICFGKQTSRVYVPPVPPVKKKVKEEEEPFILIITREWDDAPLTPENLDMKPEGGASGMIEIDTKEGELALYFRGDRDEYFGTWVTDEDTKTYIASTVRGPHGLVLLDTPTWLMKYNYTHNTWRLNIPKEFESPSGEYYILARFAEKTITTEYPRRYANSSLPGAPQAEAVEPGTYRMTIPYYEEEKSWELTDCTMDGSRFTLPYESINPEAKRKIIIKTTVPIAITPKFTHKFSGSDPNLDADIVNKYGGTTYHTGAFHAPYIYNVPTSEENPSYVACADGGGGIGSWGSGFYWRTATMTIFGPAHPSLGIIHNDYMTAPYTLVDMTISLNAGELTSTPWVIGTSPSAYRGGTTYGGKVWHYPENWDNPEIRESGIPRYNLVEAEGYVAITRSKVAFDMSIDDRDIKLGLGVPEDLESTGVTCVTNWETHDISFSGAFDFNTTYNGLPEWS